jgi:hypothetical protein
MINVLSPGIDRRPGDGEKGGPLRPHVLTGQMERGKAKCRPAGPARQSGAALRYQHATQERDRVIADALTAMVRLASVVPKVPRAPTLRG